MDVTLGGITLLLSFSLVYIGVVLSLLWAWKVTVKAPGMRDWTIGFACIGIGQVLYLAYTINGILPFAAIGYIIEIIGLVLIVRGSEIFIFDKSSILPEAIIGVLGIASSAVFTILYPHPLLRLALGNSAFALLQFRVVMLFLSRQNSAFRQSIRYIALIFSLIGLAELSQVAIVLVNGSQETYLILKPIFSVVFQFGYIGLMMTTIHLVYARFQLILAQQVEERNTLLKEMHHRTKNNLALVASLVSLESSQFPDSETSNAFNRIRTRIHTIASLHEQLQHSETSRFVQINEYLSFVLAQTRAQYANGMQDIEIITEISTFVADSKAAITLGLITNELVANAMKHAFPTNRSGKISVRFSTKDDDCELVVYDDGIGIPEAVREGTLGMQLVNALVSQLAGRLEYSIDSGTRCRVTFPAPVSMKD